MGKEYRNSARTKRLIKKTFLDLLAEKEMGHISIVDVVTKADISRNTFYYHYEDILSLQREIETDVDRTCNYYYNYIFENYPTVDLSDLLAHVCKVLTEDLEISSVLKSQNTAVSTIWRMEHMALRKVKENVHSVPPEKQPSFFAYMEYSICAALRMIQKYLLEETTLSLSDIANTMAGSFIAGIHLHQA